MEHYIEIDVEDKRSLKPFSSKQQDHDGLSAHAAPPQRSTQASAQQSSFLHYARERQAIFLYKSAMQDKMLSGNFKKRTTARHYTHVVGCCWGLLDTPAFLPLPPPCRP
jgi:hypothetical protein